MFDIKEEQKTIYTATKSGKQNIIRYEFYQSDNGWWINKERHNVEEAFAEKEQMYISDEVIEKILLVQAAKKKLTT